MYRVRSHEVRTCDLEWLRLLCIEVWDNRSDRDLDLLSSDLSHLDVVLLAKVLLDVTCEYVSGNLDAILHHDTSE